MKTFFEHIEHVRGQPHHVRKQVAFAAAAGLTALIAFVWLSASLATGAFAIRDNGLAGAADAAAGVVDSQNLAGAGAAAVLPAADAPVRIEIVDTAPAKQKPAEQTVIPF